MIEKLKKKAMIKWIIWAVVCFAIALVIVVVTFGNVFKYANKAVDIKDLDPKDVKEEMHVKGTVDMVFDCYAYREKSNGDIDEACFFIPVGDDAEYYIGLLCKGKTAKTAMDAVDALYADFEDGYYDGDNIIEVSFDGVVKPLNKQTAGFFREYVEEYFPGKEEFFLEYEINDGIFVGHEDDDYVYALVFAAIIGVVGLCFLIYGLSGSNVKAIEKYLKTQPNPEYTKQRIEQLAETTGVQGVRINEEFLFATAGSAVHFAESKSILWAYQHTVQHRTNGVPTGKTYSVMMKMRDGKQLQINMPHEDACQEVLKYMNSRIPWVIIGYDDQLMRMYNKNRAEMIRIVDEKMQQLPTGFEM